MAAELEAAEPETSDRWPLILSSRRLLRLGETTPYGHLYLAAAHRHQRSAASEVKEERTKLKMLVQSQQWEATVEAILHDVVFDFPIVILPYLIRIISSRLVHYSSNPSRKLRAMDTAYK